MKKILSFDYKYVFFFDTKEIFSIDQKSNLIKETKTIEEVLIDTSIESWNQVTTITGKKYVEFFKKKLLDKEHDHLFLIERKPFMPDDILRTALIAKRLVNNKQEISTPMPTPWELPSVFGDSWKVEIPRHL